eukprot:CAMPEP_0202696140 /NCGR_PEP_ID=MMETSP1385-20130828/9480_1 /ASSEMBLY_ACC=CAM_ASM_000861 /TAXON_ID=933848 /ORGANISM="Elphidium margaritaceum" /LENGTH=601 /DNA_ID=CAMNT_0049352251 /DNA_START=33 /DNA_END=1838 /DNA_ORIENTATION=-
MSQPQPQSEVPSNLPEFVGSRIEVDRCKGTIRYVGPVATSKNADTVWLGIEWDDANRGKNDGAVTTKDGQIHRYFTTEAGTASFIKPIKAKFGRDLWTVILDRFSLDDLADDLKEQEQIAHDSSYKIEFVGWDKSIRRQCNLQKKLSVNLEDHDVRYVDLSNLQQLRQCVPEAESIDMRRNLITKLDTFVGLSCLSETLRELNLSHNRLNVSSFQTISALVDAKTGFHRATFPNLTQLYLNNVASDAFKPWQFVYILAKNGCLPQLTELQICCNGIANFKLPAHVINNDLNGDPNDFGAGDEKCLEPDGTDIAQIMPNLSVLNIGENPLSDWREISDVFGQCPSLLQLKCSYAEVEQIKFESDRFMNMKRLWIRNNKLSDVSVFDELSKYPNLQHLSFIQCSFEDVYGFSMLRDLCIAKMPNLLNCNSSIINSKERHDAELFYLKWIAKQMAIRDEQQKENQGKDVNAESKDDENGAAEMQRIDALYPRYIELTKKHGALNFDKKETEKLMAVNVVIRSMDPESITAKPLEKKLPTAMTVGQLKMLCKRLFGLPPAYQRLMFREASGGFPEDMDDDTKALSFYSIKDGMEILMQSSNFEKK